MTYDIIRKSNTKNSRFEHEYNDLGRNIYEYDGGFLPDEDPADYYPRGITLKGVRLA